ncbi:MAG TPA: serine O-acetyltransferase [Chryseolinea sp.]|nr:serine O-acetyltransferase [Chryseolinea sp.]HPH46930.1 serine O-acetyltransferase [Chryseolinea sp.]HPM30612.1 serine O-acetyltransferase [Chryseolinea sp.]
MNKTFIEKLYQSHQACPTCPSPAEVSQFFTQLLGTLFPDFSRESFSSIKDFEAHVIELQNNLEDMIRNTPGKKVMNEREVVNQFFDALPRIHEQLHHDVEAMYSGDPAAKNTSEVIRTYPGFYATAAYRLAHQLHGLGVVGIPRVITEHAHSKTGIDIHPAAKIGEHFCIDHGTGVVIGETANIGNHVKIYQGVTLGALSVDKGDAEKKRHPTIEDNVIIYAGATILGGETVIGHDSVIGGNVWITRSVAPHSKIYYQAKIYNADTDETNLVSFKSDDSAFK